MGKPYRLIASFVLLMLMAAGTAAVFARSDAARLQGIITDQSGGLVPGAAVKVTEIVRSPTFEPPP